MRNPILRSPLLGAILCIALAGGAVAAEVIVSEDDEWRYFKGLTEASTPNLGAWRLYDFNDASWSVGRGPFYYELSSGFSGNTDLPDMNGSYTCVFLRKSFSVVSPSGIDELTLYLQSDDGCIAWLNGTEVARVNMRDGEPLYSWTSLPAAGEPNIATIVITNAASLLRAGANVLAIQAFNASPSGSSDFLIAASLSGNLDLQPPTIADVTPSAGIQVRSLSIVGVVFSESVTGVDASDLLINATPAIGLTVISPREYTFLFSEPAAGTVSISWAADAAITDLATPGNPFVGSGWTYLLDPTAPPGDVILSEFLADNSNGIRDNFASRSDWIELWNRGEEAADLSGWFLTDDAAEPTKWRFPALALPAKAYLVVWASDRNLTDPAAPLHTNFKLSPSGDYLGLLDSRTNVISEFAPTYPPQQPDISYGRDQTTPALVGYFATPTPGAANSTSGAGIAAPVVFSLSGGIYTEASLTVELSAPAGTIRYTTDGTRPTTSSTVYSTPILVQRSTVIQARVFQDGLLPSPIVVQTYNLLGTSAAGFTSNLPLLIINTAGRGIPQDSRIAAFVTEIETIRGRAGLQSPPVFQGNAQIEVRGQSSTSFPKKAYNLEINDPNGNDLEIPLLGLPSESDWVLYAPYTDKPFLQNFLAYELHEKMGHYSPRRRFVEVFIDTSGNKLEYPGDYMGIYILVEKIKVDRNRVDLERLSPQMNAEPEISGGYIVKKDKDSPGDRSFATQGSGSFSGQTLKIHEPKPDEVTAAQLNWIRNYLNQFEKAMYATTWLTATGTNHYAHYIDVDSFVDNHWIVEFPKQIDGYRLSNYMSKDRGGKLRMDPIWDWNLSFGNADYLEGEYTAGWYYPLIDATAHIWLRRLICGTTSGWGTTGDPDFRQKIADRWSVLRTDVFSSTNLLLRIDELAGYLNEAQARDFSKWPRLGVYIWPNPPLYSTPTTYAGIIANLKNWVANRYAWIDTQFLKVPQFSQLDAGVSPGFSLTMSAPLGTIYYTTDGTDPRAPGGGIAPQARQYAGSLILETNSRVVARARQTNGWSGPTAATYTVEVPRLVLTEVMYSPAPSPGSLTNDAARFEYLELLNAGTQTLDLRGFRFTEGIQFSFSTGTVTSLASGARVVVAREPAAMVGRYGTVPNLTGPYEGSLANEGERITLLGPAQERVFSLKYDPDWAPATDGLGFALVPVDEGQSPETWQQADGWRTGTVLGGTPGEPEPAAPVFPQVIISEVLSHTDPPLVGSIELQNLGSTEADVGGWHLSDDRRTPKYRIPDGTRLEPGAFFVFTEQDFNPTPGVEPSFSLRASGDEAYLYSADAQGNLTGYLQGWSFGAALNGVSFGVHRTSTGEEHFVSQAARSLGQTNGLPQVGPVVISEIQYHPPDVFTNNAAWDNMEDEFIELCNVSPITVSLFDPTTPTNTWRLRDAVAYAFPTNQMLNPGERLLVVSFDPVADPSSAARFRAQYGLASGVRLFGPYEGKLSNGGESVELIQPDMVRFYVTNYVVTSVLVDRVNYRDTNPWPAGADGLGFSLQRRVESEYGDDPVNWAAAAPTPGAALGGGTESVILVGPQSQDVPPGSMVIFSVQTSGGGQLRYQWRFNGENLLGATGSSLTLTGVQWTNSGSYEVVVSTSSRAVTSAAAVLGVGTPPRLLESPAGTEVWPGQKVVFTVIAVGDSPLHYQWRRDGVPVAGATGAAFEVPDADAAAEGAYDVVVTDESGRSATSVVADLAVLGDPVIVAQPQEMTVVAGDSAAFSVSVTNTAALPITYEWLKDDQLIASRSTESWTDTLQLTNVQAGDAGLYSVVVLNRAVALPGITSLSALLVVEGVLDTDGDGLPDEYESSHGLDPRNPEDAGEDADQDGASNRDEYLAGTDPQDAESVLKVDTVDLAAGVTISFRCLESRSYTLLYRDGLAGAEWGVVTNIAAISGTGETTRLIEVLDSGSDGQGERYYRLVTPAIDAP